MMFVGAIFPVVLAAASLVGASPAVEPLEARAAVDNIVSITSASKHCIIVPRNPKTDIGASEYPGGMKTYCTPAGRTSSKQGQLPADFWSNVAYKTGKGANGARYAQLTGCIRPEKLSRLNPGDSGGQYDSAPGGLNGKGNPEGSVCEGYKYYVELVEPADKRACIKCCDNTKDCPLKQDTAGCPSVIKGNYFNCG